MSGLELPGAALTTIRTHAAATYPAECCGALIGSDRRDGLVRIVEALPLLNTTEEAPDRRFAVRPDDYRIAERRAQALGCDLVGFYHSHPNHPARPSDYDLAHAWPNLSYLIVSVIRGQPQEVRSWRLLDNRTEFLEEDVRT